MGLPRQLAQQSVLDRRAYAPRLPRTSERALHPVPTGKTPADKSATLGISVIGHVALIGLGLMFAGASPFDPLPPDAIAVDIVSPDDIANLDSPTPPPPPPSKTETSPAEGLLSAELLPSAPAPPPTPADQPAPSQPVRGRPPTVKPTTRQAAAKLQQREPASPAPISPLQYPPSEQPTAAPPDPPQPNFTDVFGLPVTLPGGQLGGGFDAPAYNAAKITADERAAFRNHLKRCASLPGNVSPDDRVWIVLRIALSPDGALAADPTLVEASANAKGPLLMKSAVDALRRCQPYAMLPADRYEEWKILDLTFTPRDLAG